MTSLADIQAALERIRDSIYLSPAPQSETLSRATGNALCLKLENLQATGSFKERGALNRILTMSDDERARGPITASAGNHGQAVAYHAAKRGIRAQICMPVFTPIVKVSAVTGFGGEVVPVGGGGLIAGVACAIKESKPGVRVIGVQTAALPSMRAALARHHPVLLPPASTVADGIAVRQAGQRTLPLCEKYVDEIVTVDDEELAMAILWLLEKEKTLAEGAGAAGMAAMLRHMTGLRDKKVAVILSGGNIDVTMLARIIERGLVKDGRMVRLRITLPDHPGGLEKLAGLIGAERANIAQVTHDRAYFGVHLGETIIDITIETRGPQHVDQLLGKLTAAGYPFERVM
jgi:threonine dehydratase